ncbi:MAG: TonB-dependent receptor [Steroidobacteraceae bacterium]
MHKYLIGSSAMAIAMSLFPAAAGLAQTAQADVGDDSALEEIVVTGTRLASPNFTSPTPVQVLSQETIQQRAPTAIADVINEIPAFRISRSAAGSGRIADQQAGVSALLDLRGLDAVRSLILINGNRTVGTTAAGTFDTNMIPVGLIDRVDVVTGGASAAYGSDAVAGVVNFVLKNKMEGFTGNIQTGATTHGDGRQTSGSLAGGMSFAEDRGHFVIGVDAAKTEGVGNIYSRDWGRSNPGLLSVSAAQRSSLNLPAQYFTNGAVLANVTPGGLIQTAASNGNYYSFDAAGNPTVFNRGTVYGSGTTAVMTGTSANAGYNPNSFFQLQNRNERQVAYGRAQFEVNDALTLFAEANYGRTHLPQQLTSSYTMTYLVPTASLPGGLSALYSTPTVTIGRLNTEMGGGNTTFQTNNITRYVVGADGKLFNDWSWNVAYERGRTHQDFNASGIVTAAMYRAVYGCGSDATNPNIGSNTALTNAANLYEQITGKTCSPFNPFGVSNDNNAGINYFYNTQHQDNYFGQDAASASLSGSPFALWAGDVSLAAGIEWRRDTLRVVGTALGTANVYSAGNFGSYSGSNSVKEGFVEVGIPMLRDVTAVKALDFNAAVRRTDYKLSGAVSTWKAGVTYEIVDGLRLRATQSRDIRAPNLQELYFVGGSISTSLTNNIPGTFGFGNSGTSITAGTGNPALLPEKADTFTTGVTVEPSSGALAGFRGAVDYYRIKVNGAITRPSTAQTQNICSALLAAGATSCPGITFSNTGNGIASLYNMSQNLNALKVDGIDIELGYRLASLPFGMPGAFEVRALANRTFHNQQVLLTGTFENAGSMNGVPKWNGNVNFAYDLNKFGAELQVTGFSGVKYDTTSLLALTTATNSATALVVDPSDQGYLNTNGNSINRNHFPGAVYENLSAHYAVNDNVTLYGVVNNLFDVKAPEFAAIAVTNGSRNLNYDLLGRAYKAGVRVSFQ